MECVTEIGLPNRLCAREVLNLGETVRGDEELAARLRGEGDDACRLLIAPSVVESRLGEVKFEAARFMEAARDRDWGLLLTINGEAGDGDLKQMSTENMQKVLIDAHVEAKSHRSSETARCELFAVGRTI